tara:strand:- start:794 stop:2299 length:1506 start_codon:yes stop_codon:yes gene_type:complete
MKTRNGQLVRTSCFIVVLTMSMKHSLLFGTLQQKAQCFNRYYMAPKKRFDGPPPEKASLYALVHGAFVYHIDESMITTFNSVALGEVHSRIKSTSDWGTEFAGYCDKSARYHIHTDIPVEDRQLPWHPSTTSTLTLTNREARMKWVEERIIRGDDSARAFTLFARYILNMLCNSMSGLPLTKTETNRPLMKPDNLYIVQDKFLYFSLCVDPDHVDDVVSGYTPVCDLPRLLHPVPVQCVHKLVELYVKEYDHIFPFDTFYYELFNVANAAAEVDASLSPKTGDDFWQARCKLPWYPAFYHPTVQDPVTGEVTRDRMKLTMIPPFTRKNFATVFGILSPPAKDSSSYRIYAEFFKLHRGDRDDPSKELKRKAREEASGITSIPILELNNLRAKLARQEKQLKDANTLEDELEKINKELELQLDKIKSSTVHVATPNQTIVLSTNNWLLPPNEDGSMFLLEQSGDGMALPVDASGNGAHILCAASKPPTNRVTAYQRLTYSDV